MEYKDINDYELLFLIKEQNEDAEELLINKYKNVIQKHVNENINLALEHGLDNNDLFQEGLLGLTNAINTFDDNKETSFYTYASICINTKIKSILRKHASKKHLILNNSISLDNVNKTEANTYHEVITDDLFDLSEQLLKEEEQKELLDKLYSKLATFEKKVLKLKLNSYSNDEISEILNKDRRSIENALYRIRLKYQKLKNLIQ